MAAPERLSPTRLFKACDPQQFDFRTTDDVADIGDSLGQDRAVESVRFGIGIRHAGYNIFALGPQGAGKYTLVRRYLDRQAADQEIPSDWAYVNDFTDPRTPRALRLPRGRAGGLRGDMERLVDELRAAIPAAFESEDYRARREAIENELKQQHEARFNALQERAGARDIALIRTPTGLALAPIENGEVVTPDVFHKWPAERQDKAKADIAELEHELQEVLRDLPRFERAQRKKLRELDHEMTRFAVGHLIEELRKAYDDLPEVLRYLDEIQTDVIDNATDFIITPEPQVADPAMATMAMRRSLAGPPSFRRYQVNVIVDHGAAEAAPVVYEDLPNHANLVGRIEQMAQFGTLTTDFNLIKPGALHRANGGYLILEAGKLLAQPVVWEELKRALQSGEIRIHGLYETLGIPATISLEPQAIPLDIKIVLLGEPQLYYLLSQLDPEFPELFKVAADFDDRVARDGATTPLYAQLIATMARREKLKPLDRAAVARVIEQAARLAEDSERLTLRMRTISDLLSEADYWAGQDDRAVIGAADVQRAIDAQTRRADRIRERSHEQIARGTILIDTAGEAIGQVNALSVLQLGAFSFGRPSRITARVRMGRGEVLDIEREVALGGPLHSKGVLILSGFLGARFARRQPLALSASLVFEQSYGGVDGDSASSTEVYALLSALSGVPIRQSLAVTGSVNQHGEVQAIGGANEKIEGFFDVCMARQLTGDQGVLIPAANVKHLMLRQDVVDAVAEERFHIYPVSTIDEGIELLTGVAAGAPDADGEFPDGTVNGLAQAQIRAFAEQARKFAPGQTWENQTGEKEKS
jgi:lon-related putative ATP-dependent protease